MNRRKRRPLHVGILTAFPLLIMVSGGCAKSGPSAQDYRLAGGAFQAEAAEARRASGQLRAEAQNLQRELGAARVAHARMEAELREAGRQLAEARHVVDLQREELAHGRQERDRMAQTGRDLQGQLVELGRLHQQVAEARREAQDHLTELGRLRQKASEAERERARIRELEATIGRQAKEANKLKAKLQNPPTSTKPENGQAVPSPPSSTSPTEQARTGRDSIGDSPRTITVKAGDTLYSLARKHRVDLADLKSVNRLVTDIILPGQELVLPDSPRG